MGSPTGDGAIAALQGKAEPSQFQQRQTGDGRRPPAAAQFPAAEEVARPRTSRPAGRRKTANATRLLIDGPFTNQGLASLAGLEGVSDLDLFWHVSGITPTPSLT